MQGTQTVRTTRFTPSLERYRAPDAPWVTSAADKTPHLIVRFQGVVQDTAPEPSTTEPRRLTIRLNGRVQAVIPIPTAPIDEAADLHDLDEGDLDEDVDSDEINLIGEVDRLLASDKSAQDAEDGPDWMFDKGETTSPNPDYVFCPAVHRQQILHLFTKHFCQHPIFPERHGSSLTADAIRRNAVKEMYDFCKRRNLREVWGYLWACWYTPKMWKLWARSTSPYLSRLRTTMGVENFWRQLKHNYLHNCVRPRLDQLIWILIYKVTPEYFARMEGLNDSHRLGRSKPLTAYQRRFKVSWKKMQTTATSGKVYKTDVATWTCNCGRQKYQCNHLCKHLVQAVASPTQSFWRNVIRRRVLPIYRHPALVNKATTDQEINYIEPDSESEGAVTNGDDHKWSGNPSILEDGGGWEALAVTTSTSKRLRANSAQNHSEHPSNKRTRRQDTQAPASAVPENIPENAAQTLGANHNHDVIDLTLSSPMPSPHPSQVPAPVESEAGFSDSSGFDYGTDDEHEVSILQQITVLGCFDI